MSFSNFIRENLESHFSKLPVTIEKVHKVIILNKFFVLTPILICSEHVQCYTAYQCFCIGLLTLIIYYCFQSGAKINISDGSCPERIVTVTGNTSAIFKAFTLICKKFEEVCTNQYFFLRGHRPPLAHLIHLPFSKLGLAASDETFVNRRGL